ncbi:MAG: nitrogen fixation protein NifQ [Pseudomonadota bacterium]
MSNLDLRVQRENLYRRILGHARGGANDGLLAKMMSSAALGIGVLPTDLGLDVEGVSALLERHFPGLRWSLEHGARQLDRFPEQDDLVALMLEHAPRCDPEIIDVARIVAAACMGGNHLWEDLGLWSRADLSELIRHNFPDLAARNTGDMKWKKFLYKQLCQREGIYVCRAPSCEVCADYALCFGPEE